jgi:hypothetical protein
MAVKGKVVIVAAVIRAEVAESRLKDYRVMLVRSMRGRQRTDVRNQNNPWCQGLHLELKLGAFGLAEKLHDFQ